MPIEFACDCGKTFRARDEHAGKRTKCTACGTALTVPAAPAAVSEEDAAFLALSEGPDPEPARRDWRDDSVAPPAPAAAPRMLPAEKAPPKKKPKKSSYHDPYAMPERKWNVDWGRVGGGGVGVLLGGGLLIGGLSAGRFFIWSPVIIIGGIVGIINGLTHRD